MQGGDVMTSRKLPSLASLGIDKNLAKRARAAAAMSEDEAVASVQEATRALDLSVDMAFGLTNGRSRTRPRGFVDWQPDANSKLLLEDVNAVLAEYANYLPLTIRQIFYRLVGAHDYPKTENDYKRLCRMLNRARRAELISMEYIRDDGGTEIKDSVWAGADAFVHDVQAWAEEFKLDRQSGQRVRLVVMCEAAGMAPQLAQVANPYGIPVLASGGFDSVTFKHNFARDYASEEEPVEVLHIGDHDPSGVHIFKSLEEDVIAFGDELGGEINFTRLAVTPEQIRQYHLPTAPPKPTDRRSFDGQTCQAEALPPDVMAQVLRTAITERINQRQYQRLLREEKVARAALIGRLGAL